MKNIMFFKFNVCMFGIVLTIALLLGNFAVADDTSDSSTPKGSENGDSVVDTSGCDEKEGQQHRIALVVGINDYDYEIEGNPIGSFYDDETKGIISPVTSAEKVAEALNEVGFCIFKYLVKKQLEGRIDTLQNVLQDFGNKVKENSIVVIYFSGHAISERGQIKFLLASHEKNDDGTRGLRLGRLFTVAGLNSEEKKRNMIFIIDACRNENSPKQIRAQLSDACMEKQKSEKIIDCLKELVDTAAVPSSEHFTAYSAPLGLQAQADGIYSGHLTNLIRQPDLSLNELFSELAETVAKEREEKGADTTQQPYIEAPLDKFKQFYLGGKKPLKLILRF